MTSRFLGGSDEAEWVQVMWYWAVSLMPKRAVRLQTRTREALARLLHPNSTGLFGLLERALLCLLTELAAAPEDGSTQGTLRRIEPLRVVQPISAYATD